MTSSKRLAFLGLALALAGCSLGDDQPEGGPSTSPSSPSDQLVIVSALPRAGRAEPQTDAMVAGIRQALQARGNRAGPYRVRYVDSDTADPEFAEESEDVCAERARQYGSDARIVAVIGPRSTLCARFLIPALNRAGVAVVGTNPDHPAFTHSRPGGRLARAHECFECEPDLYYRGGPRNFGRVVPTVDTEGAAAARLMRERGVREVFLLDIGDGFATAWLWAGFVAEAARGGPTVVGRSFYELGDAEATAKKVAASGAEALYFLAPTYNRGAEVLEAVRAAGFRGLVVGSLSIHDESLLTDAGASAEGALFTAAKLPVAAFPPDGKVAADRLEGQFASDAVYAAEAANVVLDAIAASDGTRPGVRRALFETLRRGLLGPLRIDANGDVRPQRVAVFEARRGRYAYEETLELEGPPG